MAFNPSVNSNSRSESVDQQLNSSLKDAQISKIRAIMLSFQTGIINLQEAVEQLSKLGATNIKKSHQTWDGGFRSRIEFEFNGEQYDVSYGVGTPPDDETSQLHTGDIRDSKINSQLGDLIRDFLNKK